MKSNLLICLVAIFVSSSLAAEEFVTNTVDVSDCWFCRVQNHSVGTGIPLILVHGLDSEEKSNCRWNSFLKNAADLPEFNRFDVWYWRHNTKLPVGFNGRTGNAAQFARQLNETFGNQKVLLIAHSRGGLVCRAFMNYQRQGDQVLGLITLGTPHHGTPGMVPNWSRAVLENPTFNEVAKQYPPSIAGARNIGWDNCDGAVETSLKGNETSLTPNDFNCRRISGFPPSNEFGVNDYSSLDNLNDTCGTLAELNAIDQYLQKISTFAAYDDDLSDTDCHEFYIDEIFDFLSHDDHGLLKFSTWKLSNKFAGFLPGTPINYFANDGLVPVQSALCLDISGRTPFAFARGQTIILQNITARQLVKSMHVFSRTEDGIGDHLDLLETRNERYWRAIIYETKRFLGDSDAVLYADTARPVVRFSEYRIAEQVCEVADRRTRQARAWSEIQERRAARRNDALLANRFGPDMIATVAVTKGRTAQREFKAASEQRMRDVDQQIKADQERARQRNALERQSAREIANSRNAAEQESRQAERQRQAAEKQQKRETDRERSAMSRDLALIREVNAKRDSEQSAARQRTAVEKKNVQQVVRTRRDAAEESRNAWPQKPQLTQIWAPERSVQRNAYTDQRIVNTQPSAGQRVVKQVQPPAQRKPATRPVRLD